MQCSYYNENRIRRQIKKDTDKRQMILRVHARIFIFRFVGVPFRRNRTMLVTHQHFKINNLCNVDSIELYVIM